MLASGWIRARRVSTRAGAHARSRGAEAIALAASWLTLLALARGRPELAAGTPPPVALAALAAALGSAWLVPGLLLFRLARRGRPAGALEALPLSFGLGLAWLLVPATVVLFAEGNIGQLTALVTAMTGALSVACLVLRPRAAPAAMMPARVVAERGSRPGTTLVLAGAAAVAAMMLVSARAGFTRASDEWVQLAASRYFLEARSIESTWTFDVWSLLLALMARLSGVDLIEAYRLYLSPLLVLMAALSLLWLARVLFEDARTARLALLVQAVYCFTDMTPRGDGAGMGFVVRILEDRYAACFVAVPLAQAALVLFLRGEAGWLAVGGALALAAVALNPMALLWLGLPLSGVACMALARHRPALRRSTAFGLALFLGAVVGLAWWLRSLRPGAYFQLRDPGWSFGATLLRISPGKLLVLSSRDEWYMADPRLLAHPLLLAAVVAGLLLLPRFGRSPAAQFVAAGTLAPVLLIFNPWTATFLGGWITPWLLYRLLWGVPVALALACVLDELRRWTAGRAGTREPSTASRHAVTGGLAALAVVAALLAGRFESSSRALAARNHVRPTRGERELARALARGAGLGGTLLAPDDLSIRLPAWTSRFHVLPGLEAMRFNQRPLLEGCAEFYASDTVGERQAALLRERRIDYVLVETGSVLEGALAARPAAFPSVYRGPELSLYRWRPERWAGSPP